MATKIPQAGTCGRQATFACGVTGCGWRNRTAYLQVMSLPSYQCSNPLQCTGRALILLWLLFLHRFQLVAMVPNSEYTKYRKVWHGFGYPLQLLTLREPLGASFPYISAYCPFWSSTRLLALLRWEAVFHTKPTSSLSAPPCILYLHHIEAKYNTNIITDTNLWRWVIIH